MKTLLFSLLTVLGVAFGNAGVAITDLLGSVSPELSVTYSDLSTHRGVATREDSVAFSALVGVPVEGAHISVGVDLHDVDGDTEKDWSVAYARPVEIFGQSLGARIHLQRIDSSHGGWEEVGLALTYSHDIADLTTTVWHEADSSGPYGVEIMVSRDFATPVASLTITPFAAAHIADEYDGVEAGIAATYKLDNGLSLFLKGAYNDNDLDSSSAYSLEHDWSVGAGVSFKF
jgi:predicted porin